MESLIHRPAVPTEIALPGTGCPLSVWLVCGPVSPESQVPRVVAMALVHVNGYLYWTQSVRQGGRVTSLSYGPAGGEDARLGVVIDQNPAGPARASRVSRVASDPCRVAKIEVVRGGCMHPRPGSARPSGAGEKPGREVAKLGPGMRYNGGMMATERGPTDFVRPPDRGNKRAGSKVRGAAPGKS
jgi:hypothetical protein